MQFVDLQIIGNRNDPRDDRTDVVEHGAQHQALGWGGRCVSHRHSIHRPVATLLIQREVPASKGRGNLPCVTPGFVMLSDCCQWGRLGGTPNRKSLIGNRCIDW